MDSKKTSGRITLSKKDIIAAATELFLTEGYQHVSIRKIANKIGCSSTNLYNHFKNKEEILLFMLKDGYAIFLGYLLEAINVTKDKEIIVKIKAVIRAYIQFSFENPDYYKIMFIQNMEGRYNLSIKEETDQMKGFTLIVELIREAIHLNVISSNDELLTSQSLWASIHGISSLFITFPGFHWADRDALIDIHIDNCLKGLQR